MVELFKLKVIDSMILTLTQIAADKTLAWWLSQTLLGNGSYLVLLEETVWTVVMSAIL